MSVYIGDWITPMDFPIIHNKSINIDIIKTQSAHPYSVFILVMIATSVCCYLSVVDSKKKRRRALPRAASSGADAARVFRCSFVRLDMPAIVRWHSRFASPHPRASLTGGRVSCCRLPPRLVGWIFADADVVAIQAADELNIECNGKINGMKPQCTSPVLKCGV